jgi:hypothetical protein
MRIRHSRQILFVYAGHNQLSAINNHLQRMQDNGLGEIQQQADLQWVGSSI